jgi:hypothetical protein
MKPKLLIEKILDKEASYDQCPERFPHCDARILHIPSDCVYCAKATWLQKEREDRGVSNTGHSNRSWPCPADKVRSKSSQNSWGGNRPKTNKDLEEEDKFWKELKDKLKADVIEIDGDD